MPVSPKILLSHLARISLFGPRRRRTGGGPLFPPRLSSATSLLGRHLPRPTRKLLILVVLLFTVFYVSSLLDNNQSSTSASSSSSRFRLGHLLDRRRRPGWLNDSSDGSVKVEEEDWKEGHPIRALMAEARREWDDKLARRSTTLEEAVETYKTRYGRSPPRGFGAWWIFVQTHEVLIVDDYDSIDHSITPFLALPPHVLSSRLSNLLANEPFSSEVHIRSSAPVNATGERADYWRSRSMRELLEGLRPYLPKDFGEGEGHLGQPGGDEGIVRMSLSDHDLGGKVMGEEFRRVMTDLAGRGEYIEEKELRDLENVNRKDDASTSKPKGLLQACSLKSLVERKPASNKDIVSSLASSDEHTSGPISFIHNHLKSFDFCHNPSLIPYHGSYSHDNARNPTLIPQFVVSKYVQSNQILVTPLDAYDDSGPRLAWEKKRVDKILWRGSTTGDFFSNQTDWRQSHRPRLNSLTNAVEGHVDVLVEESVNRHFWNRNREEVSMQRLDVGALNKHLFDVGITKVDQCSDEDGTCEEMDWEIELAEKVPPEEAVLYRYALDIDGNGWSSRFRNLLSMGQVVFKITIFPEWNTEWLTPWPHYVPVSVDLSDLYHTSTFFLGVPGVSRGNDELAQTISEAGVLFVANHWRWEDQQAYMFRLLLEYRRAMAHDRDAMSMGGKMVLLPN